MGSVATSNVHTVEFDAHRVLLADPKQYDLHTNRYPSNAWKEIIRDRRQVVLRGESPPALPFVRIDPKPPTRMLQLDPVRVKVPSRVILEIADRTTKIRETQSGAQPDVESQNPIELRATIESLEGTFNVVADGPVQLQAHELTIDERGVVAPNQPATLTVEFDHENEKISITSNPGPSDFVFTPLSNLVQNILPAGPLHLSHPEFLAPIPNANPHSIGEQTYASSILDEGQVLNHEFPERVAKIPPRAFLHLSDDAGWQLMNLAVVSSTGGIQIELQGHPPIVDSTADLSSSDSVRYQMSWLEYVMESKPTRLFFAIGVWFLTTTVAAYKLFKDLRKEAGV